VLAEAGSVLAAAFLCDFLWLVEDDFLWCLVVVGVDVLDAAAGAAAAGAAGAGAIWSWASTEPERATPATSREAIASLRIMIMSLEI
jgi:hypothetical protein